MSALTTLAAEVSLLGLLPCFMMRSGAEERKRWPRDKHSYSIPTNTFTLSFTNPASEGEYRFIFNGKPSCRDLMMMGARGIDFLKLLDDKFDIQFDK